MKNIHKVLRRSAWISLLTKYSEYIVQFIISVVLARILSPQQFGVLSLVFVFINLGQMISESGLSTAVVQSDDLDEYEKGVLFNFSILQGIFFGIAFAGVFKFLAYFYGNPVYAKMAHLVFIIILLKSLQVIPTANLRKSLRFEFMGVVSITVNLVSGLLGVFLALKGFGVYSLIYQSVISSILMFIIYYLAAKMVFVYKIQLDPFKKVFKYAINQFGFNIINYFARNMDNVLVGKFLGETSLGLYDRAYKLMFYPIQALTFALTPVLHPVLTKVNKDKKELSNLYLKMFETLALISIPMISFLFFYSSEIVHILYGRAWEPCIPVFKILCVLSGLQVLTATTGSVFQAVGKTDVLFKVGLYTNGLLIVGILIGVYMGSIVYVALTYAIAYSITFFPIFFVLSRLIEAPFKEFIYPLGIPLLISIALALVLMLKKHFLPISNDYISFATGSAVAGLTYIIMLYITGSKDKLMRIIRDRKIIREGSE